MAPTTTEYAKIENGIVVEVIVADAAFVDSLPGTWVLTPYNSGDGSGKVGVGYTYVDEIFAAPEIE